MSLNQKFNHYFKMETQNAGQKLVLQDKVFVCLHSDTQVQVIIRALTPIKVIFKAVSIENTNIVVNCSCKVFLKQKLCQHIWAALVQLDSVSSDFLSNKNSLTLQVNTSTSPQTIRFNSRIQNDLAKEKAASFRKAQYLKMKNFKKKKTINNDLQNQKKSTIAFSQEIQAALDYFEKNGFSISNDPNQEVLIKAKKSLARIFHPDRGGSHEETVELNKNFEILALYLK